MVEFLDGTDEQMGVCEMYEDSGYTTPEGFWLPRRLLLPNVRSFDEVLTYVREWDHSTMTHTSGSVPRPEMVPAPAMIGENELGPFCTIGDRAEGLRRSVAVVPTQLALDAIAPRIVTDDDRLSFSVIIHAENGRALVLAQHGYIIGSHWLAYIDPSTIPASPIVEG